MIPNPPFDRQETLAIVSADNRRLRAEIEYLRGLLRRSEWYLRHDQECPLRFTRERGSGLSKSHCDCGLHRLDEEIDSALGTSDQPTDVSVGDKHE